MIMYPTRLEDWEGFEIEADGAPVVERGFIDHWLEAVREANPLYWNDDIAEEIAGSIVTPAPMIPTFLRNYRWSPKHPEMVWDMHGVEPPGTPAPLRLPNEAHYALKDFLGLKEGIVASIESEFHAPLRLGDRVRVKSRIVNIGPERTNKLGKGRSWVAEAVYHNQRGELLGTDRYTFFSYNRPAVPVPASSP